MSGFYFTVPSTVAWSANNHRPTATQAARAQGQRDAHFEEKVDVMTKGDIWLDSRGEAVSMERGEKRTPEGRAPNQRQYPGQLVLVVAYGSYAYLVPSVEESTHYFLKTIIPSRKATRDYLERRAPDEKA